MSVQKKFQLVAIAIFAALVVIALGRGVSGAGTQDLNSLDRRISMLEQRFYSLESSMNRLQQVIASQRSTSSPASVSDRDVDQLQAELQRLRLRLNEVECGLVKLDERTATASGNRRGGEARPADPCRQNPNTPLRLPTRP